MKPPSNVGCKSYVNVDISKQTKPNPYCYCDTCIVQRPDLVSVVSSSKKLEEGLSSSHYVHPKHRHNDCCLDFEEEKRQRKRIDAGDIQSSDLSSLDLSKSVKSKSAIFATTNDNCGKDGRINNINSDNNDDVVKTNLDGGYAWLILAVMFLLQSSISGSSRVYGLVYAKEVDIGHYDREQASWPIATASAIENLASILTPALVQLFSWRQIELTAGLLFVISNLGTYFSDSLAIDVICLGGIQGLALSLSTVLSLAINNDYFERYRTTAYGISMAGSTFGVLYLSPLVSWLLDTFDDFRLAYLALAGVFCGNVLLALFIKPRAETLASPARSSSSSLAHLTKRSATDASSDSLRDRSQKDHKLTNSGNIIDDLKVEKVIKLKRNQFEDQPVGSTTTHDAPHGYTHFSHRKLTEQPFNNNGDTFDRKSTVFRAMKLNEGDLWWCENALLDSGQRQCSIGVTTITDDDDDDDACNEDGDDDDSETMTSGSMASSTLASTAATNSSSPNINIDTEPDATADPLRTTTGVANYTSRLLRSYRRRFNWIVGSSNPASTNKAPDAITASAKHPVGRQTSSPAGLRRDLSIASVSDWAVERRCSVLSQLSQEKRILLTSFSRNRGKHSMYSNSYKVTSLYGGGSAGKKGNFCGLTLSSVRTLPVWMFNNEKDSQLAPCVSDEADGKGWRNNNIQGARDVVSSGAARRVRTSPLPVKLLESEVICGGYNLAQKDQPRQQQQRQQPVGRKLLSPSCSSPSARGTGCCDGAKIECNHKKHDDKSCGRSGNIRRRKSAPFLFEADSTKKMDSWPDNNNNNNGNNNDDKHQHRSRRQREPTSRYDELKLDPLSAAASAAERNENEKCLRKLDAATKKHQAATRSKTPTSTSAPKGISSSHSSRVASPVDHTTSGSSKVTPADLMNGSNSLKEDVSCVVVDINSERRRSKETNCDNNNSNECSEAIVQSRADHINSGIVDEKKFVIYDSDDLRLGQSSFVDGKPDANNNNNSRSHLETSTCIELLDGNMKRNVDYFDEKFLKLDSAERFSTISTTFEHADVGQIERGEIYNSSDNSGKAQQSSCHDATMHEEFNLTTIGNLLRSPYLHLTWLMLSLYFIVARVFVIILVDFAKDHSLDSESSRALLNYWSLGELCGRLLLGSLIDLQWISVRNCISLTCGLLSASIFAMICFESYIVYALCSAFVAALISLEYMLINVLLVEYMGKQRVTGCYALAALISSTILFARPMLIGLFRDRLGSYDGLLLLLSALSLLIALLFAIVEPICARYWLGTDPTTTAAPTCTASEKTSSTRKQQQQQQQRRRSS